MLKSFACTLYTQPPHRSVIGVHKFAIHYPTNKPRCRVELLEKHRFVWGTCQAFWDELLLRRYQEAREGLDTLKVVTKIIYIQLTI